MYFKDFQIRWILASSVILNAALFLFLLMFIRQSNVPIVLHYNIDWGVDYFGEVKSIFILPSIGWLIFLFNGILASHLWRRYRALSYFLTIVILIVQIFLWISGIALYIINS